MKRAHFSEAADRDLLAILDYVTEMSGSIATATSFVRKLRQHCHHMASLPGTLGRGRPELGEGLRSVPHGNYIIFFRYQKHRFEVLAVLHGARDLNALTDKS